LVGDNTTEMPEMTSIAAGTTRID